MSSCFKCGVDESRAILFDAISPKGIVKICRKCSIIEGLPIIRKNTEQEDEEKKKVAENFARNQTEQRRYGRPLPRSDDLALRNLVDSNFKKNLKEDLELKKTLVDNFHWALLRARRGKKMTQEQLAVALREPLIALQTLERGFVPENGRELIIKLENYLFIRLRKPIELQTEKKPQRIDFRTPGNVKIADLKEIKSQPEPLPNDDEEELYDLSKEEMDELKRNS